MFQKKETCELTLALSVAPETIRLFAQQCEQMLFEKEFRIAHVEARGQTLVVTFEKEEVFE